MFCFRDAQRAHSPSRWPSLGGRAARATRDRLRGDRGRTAFRWWGRRRPVCDAGASDRDDAAHAPLPGRATAAARGGATHASQAASQAQSRGQTATPDRDGSRRSADRSRSGGSSAAAHPRCGELGLKAPSGAPMRSPSDRPSRVAPMALARGVLESHPRTNARSTDVQVSSHSWRACRRGDHAAGADRRPERTSSAAQESSNPINDQGSSYDYRSFITAVTPHVRGLSLKFSSSPTACMLTNHTGNTVTIYGYQGEPYARVLADGGRSQHDLARLLPESELLRRGQRARLGPRTRHAALDDSSTAPASSNGTTTASTGCRPSRPRQVKDKGKRTKIFHWQVPIQVGAQQGDVNGELFWVPEESKTPALAIVALVRSSRSAWRSCCGCANAAKTPPRRAGGTTPPETVTRSLVSADQELRAQPP